MLVAAVWGFVSVAGAVKIFIVPRGPLGIAPGIAGMVNATVFLLCAAGDSRV